MMPYRLLCVMLFGAFGFIATYQILLWLRERRGRLLPAAALHATAAAAFALALFLMAQANTVAAMERAVMLRAVCALALLASVAYLLRQLSGRPAIPHARLVIAVAVVVGGVRLIVATPFPPISDVTQIAAMGDLVWVPVRAAVQPHWVAGGLAVLVHGYGIVNGLGLRREDPVASTILTLSSVGSIAAVPCFATLSQPFVAWQPIAVLPQCGYVLLGSILVAREHARRAEARGEAERLFRAMFDQTYQLVGLLDVHGRVLDINRHALSRGGARLEDVVGRPFADTQWWIGSPQRERCREAVHEAARGETVAFEAVHLSSDGSEFLVAFSIRPLRDEHGQVVALIPESHDITEARAAEVARRRAEEQLQQTRKLEAVGQLAGGIAHDFNNLLTVIHGFAALLADAPALRSRQAELLQVQDASERAMSLTRQLLTFSQHGVSDEQVVDLDGLVARSVPLLRRLVGSEIELAYAPGTALPPVKVDAHQFERVLLNLVVNARDAMPRGGRVEIRTRLRDRAVDDTPLPPDIDDWVVLAVGDTGVGMPPHVRERLFEPFFTTKGPGKGTGLGLAIVDRVVTQARGVVTVQTAEGQGTTFTIFLPAATPDAPTSPCEVAPETAGTGHETILVVDDEDALRSLAVLSLEQQGYTVLQAGSPPDALAVAQAHAGRIDLLLSDVVMPGGSAASLVERLLPLHPELQVLFMSGYPADEAVRRGVVAGAHNFLQKPFTPTVLASRVRALLDARSPAP